MKTNLTSMGKNKTKSTVQNNVKQFPIKMKKKLTSQQSQPDVASPPRRSPINAKSAEQTVPTSPIDTNSSQRRSSPRLKEFTEPTDTNNSQRGSSPRSKESAEPRNPQSTTQTPSHQQHLTSPWKVLASKRKKVLTPTKSKQDSAKGGKTVRRILDMSTGPCPNIQLVDPNDTFSDFEEEEEDETLQHDKDVQVEEPDVDSDGEKDNGDHDSEGGTDDKPEGEEGEVVEPTNKRKFVPRGPTQMYAKAKVPFNSKERPIDDPSVQLASCLGVLVRRKIPLTFKDWRVVPHQAKFNIWKIVEQRFIVYEHFQDYYFSKMGAYLKEARSRKDGLVLEALDHLKGEEREKRLANLMPTSMSVN
ncbi:uncharacterized protein LOC113353625 [Papaver somniferum]|uniref:uncharacterized protein LOC113353625 n=1 Tax=Papaver somniferum TaxID=3469 RepID=UPI000E704E90|nr:uncharacterized protein LOC113353625 [Papaver somniferum]